MNENLRQKAGLIYNIVESVILLMSVGLMLWMCRIVIDHGNTLASHTTELKADNIRLDRIEVRGSEGLQSHVKEDDTRITDMKSRLDRLESAVIALQSAPGELKAISARLDAMRESQSRIERAIEEHVRSNGNNIK